MAGPRVALACCVLVVVAGCAGAPTDTRSPPGTTPPGGTGPDTTPGDTGPDTTTGDPGSGTTPGEPGTRTTPPTDSRDTGSRPEYEAYVFDHGGTDRPAIDGGITYPSRGTGDAQLYATVVDGASGAERFDHSVLDTTASAFVRNTSFEESTLVVIQAFPASSYPDYRVESVRRTSDGLDVRINDSSEGGTADITVETVLLRIGGDVPGTVTVTTEEGRTVDAGEGVVTVTPEPTPTPESDVALPYASDDPDENVAEPRRLEIENRGTRTNGYRVAVVYHDGPDCRTATPPCGESTREVTVLDRRGKLPPGATVTVPELAVRTGAYTVSASAEVPAGNDSRLTVTDSLEWSLDGSSGHLAVTVTDDGVSVEPVEK